MQIMKEKTQDQIYFLTHFPHALIFVAFSKKAKKLIKEINAQMNTSSCQVLIEQLNVF